MVNVNVVVRKESFGSQLFDKLHAYVQSLSEDFTTNLEIIFSDDVIEGYTNILFLYMPEYVESLEKYDLVIFDNCDEPLGTVATEFMIKNLDTPNVYYQIGSIFHSEKKINHEKIIPMIGDAENFYRYVATPFYPQYYQKNNKDRNKTVLFINGANQAHRHHIKKLLQTHTTVDCKNNISNVNQIHETKDSLLESEKDREFREYCNSNYKIERNSRVTYYEQSIICGIDGKMGKIPPGYIPLPEYYQYRVIAYPESTWINDELILTEKSLKCFYTKSLPFPIGGRSIHKLINELGFTTAWNILPKSMQQFDQEEDHLKRYIMITKAIDWLDKNINNLDNYEQIVEDNFNLFMSNKFARQGVEKLYKVLTNL